MIKLLINNIKSKPTGNLGKSHNPDGSLKNAWITQGHEYNDWKNTQILFVKSQLTQYPDHSFPLTRVYGVISRIAIASNRKGHPPDKYNLEGAIADILTQSCAWTDDNVNVSPLGQSRIVYNNLEVTQVFLCLNYEEYASMILDELFLLSKTT